MFPQACVKNSVHGGRGGVHPWADTPLASMTPPLGRHPRQAAAAADGTHPTECILVFEYFCDILHAQDNQIFPDEFKAYC